MSKHLPKRFERWSDRLAERAFSTVFLLRVFFLMSPLLHAFFGISKVRFRTHILASALAYVVPIFLICYFGQQALDYIERAPLLHIGIGVLIVVKASIIAILMRRHFQKRARERAAHAAPSAAR